MPAAFGDAAELLDVDVEQLARSLAHIADRDAGRPVLVPQARESPPGQHVPDGRAGHAHDGREAVRPEPMVVTGGEDGIDLLLRQGPWRTMGPRRPVHEPRLALGSNRRSHFQAVWRLTPAMCAAWATAIPSMTIRSTRKPPAERGELALRCATRASRSM